MKTSIKLFVLALAISLASCSKSNDDNPSNNNNNNSNINEQVSGNWTVTYYFDSGKDETSDYSGYSFEFATDGTLTAIHSTGNFAGTWRIGDSSSDDDSSSNRFVITITGNKRMDDLQDDWVIDSISDTEIRLRDDNPASAEELRFGK
jgi:hypothetical protein